MHRNYSKMSHREPGKYKKLELRILRYLGFVRSIFLLFFDQLGHIFPRRRNETLKKKLLLVRLDAIGDFVLWLDAAKEMRKLYPQNKHEITLLGNQDWIPLASDLPYFDKVWSLNRSQFLNNIFYRLKIIKKVRQEAFALAIQPTFSREFLYGDTIIKMSSAAERIGYEGDFTNLKRWQKRISDSWYTKIIPASNKPLMELERNAEFLRNLGLTMFRSNVPALPVSMSLPKDFSLHDYYIISPSARIEIKRWPLLKFSELAARIYEKTGWTAVICGGSGEEHLGAILTTGSPVPMQNWTGKTSLSELIAMIYKSRLLVSNDTAAIHMAAAVATPSVCIVGGGHFGRFIPYQIGTQARGPLPRAVHHKMDCFGCNWECIYNVPRVHGGPAPCLAIISIDQVFEAVIYTLSAHRHHKSNQHDQNK